jgi:OmpA-OmpF porin, OOP family
MKRVTILILAFSIGIGSLHAQSALERLGKRIVKRTSEQVEQRIERKVEEGVEKAMDKAEESALKSGKENEKTTQPANEKSKEPKTIQQPQKEQVALQSFSQYDFVPGDKVLLFEDFSQDAIGDFPAMWTTNGSGEVKTLNINEGKWLHLTTVGNQYQLMKNLVLPENYIIEFDVVLPPTEQNPPALWMTLFKAENEDLGYVQSNPLSMGFGLYMESTDNGNNKWMGKAYNGDWVEGSSIISPLMINKVEHVIVWVQKRRLRVYHAGEKVLDLPTIIPANIKPNRLTFDNSDCNDSNPYISNLRITTATPDTRNKLLEEGKLISYGIYFDVNSDKVKPESFGALNDIAKVVKEAGVKVQIVGHTDNSGNNAINIDLSKRRAISVKAELVKMGVSAQMLTADGAGSSKPIAPNDTPSNKALNRRVEFVKL